MRQVLCGSLLILTFCIAISPSLAEESRPAYADLVIVRPPPLHSYAREERIVPVTIANIGTAVSEPTELVAYRLDGERREVTRMPVPWVDPGSTHSIHLILFETVAGEVPLQLSIDPEGRIEEADKSNNDVALNWNVEIGRDGWCCLGGGVYSSSEISCDRRRGDFLFSRREAERSCQGEPPRLGWCCNAEEKIFETGELACRIAGGALFDNLNQAQAQCKPVADSDAGPFSAIDDVGPDHPGGRMIGLVAPDQVSGTATKIRYAAAPWGGVWRSDDEGDTWSQLIRSQPDLGQQTTGGIEAQSILDIAVSPTDEKLVLVAGYDNVRKKQHLQSGIYRSINGGASWKLVKQFHWPKIGNAPAEVAAPTQIRFAPDDPKLVYAAHGSGVSFSTDVGVTWKTVMFKGTGTGHGQKRVYHVAVAPKEAVGKRRVYACGGGSVWYSEDGGKKWSEDAAAFLPASHTHCGGTGMGVGTAARVLEVEPGKPDHVYLAYRHLANGPRYFVEATTPQGSKIMLPETDGVACGSNAPLNTTHQQLLGKTSHLHDCGEGSLWLGDFSKFDPKVAGEKATWTKMQGPPVYYGGSTPSGRVYLHAHKTKSGYLLFFSDRTHLHVTVGRPEADGWHRLDGHDISMTRRDYLNKKAQFHNRMRMHVDPHAIWTSADFDLTLKDPVGVNAPYDKNKELNSCLGGQISLANDGGIYNSSDCGKSWKAAKSGPKTLILMNMAGLTSAYTGPALYFGTADNDDRFSRDGGAAWKDVIGSCGDCDRWYYDAADSTQVYELGYPKRKGAYLRVYRSPSGGFPDVGSNKTTQLRLLPYPQPTFFQDFDTAGSRPVVVPLANETPVPEGIFVVIERLTNGTRRIVQTTGVAGLPNMSQWNGAQIKQYWETHGSPWKPVLSLPAAAANAETLQVSGGQHYPVFYVGDGTSLWKSFRNPTSQQLEWQQIVPQPATATSDDAIMARRFFVNPYNPKELYIIGFSAVKRSDDGGLSWSVDKTLNDAVTQNGRIAHHCWSHFCVINDLVFDRIDPKVRFALGTGGIFHSQDGLAWNRILDPAALACRPVSGVYDPVGNHLDPTLFVACYGRGVLKLHHVVKRIYPDILLARPPMIRRVFPNDDFIIDWRLLLKNAGDLKIDRETLVSIFLDGKLVRKEVANALEADESTELDFFLEVKRGHHELTVVLDSGDDIIEQDEQNNSYTHEFDLGLQH